MDRARLEAGDVAVGIVALVAQNGFRLYLCRERFGLGDVMDLTAGQTKCDRISEGVDDHMDFRGQASARTTYGLVDALPFTRPGVVLVRSYNGGVDHGVFVVGIIRQRFEKLSQTAFVAQRRNACECSSRRRTASACRAKERPSEISKLQPRRTGDCLDRCCARRIHDDPATVVLSVRTGRLATRGGSS